MHFLSHPKPPNIPHQTYAKPYSANKPTQRNEIYPKRHLQYTIVHGFNSISTDPSGNVFSGFVSTEEG
jgi:hypothetical protein